MGLQGGHWQFRPRSRSNQHPSEARRLFTLSLEDPVSWKPDDARRLTPVSDFKNRNLSLVRRKGEEGDRGDYVCTLEFDKGLTLTRTVHVDVLESKSRRAPLSQTPQITWRILTEARKDEWRGAGFYRSFYFTHLRGG